MDIFVLFEGIVKLWRTIEVSMKTVFYDDSSKLCCKRGPLVTAEGLKFCGGSSKVRSFDRTGFAPISTKIWEGNCPLPPIPPALEAIDKFWVVA